VLRGLADRGAVAAGVETVFPSTTWPTHTTLTTGVSPRVHGVVANSILNRRTRQREDLTGDPIYDAPELVRAPTVYDCAHAAGLRTAAIDWPATRHARTLDFNLPFFKDQRVFETQTSRVVWDELAALGYPMDRQGEWAQLPKRFLKDAMVANVAAHVVRRHAPDLLLLHFLCVDSLQHLFGPRSPEAYWALEYVDGLVGRVLDALARDTTTAFVVSDHGFLPSSREIRPNVRLRTLGAAAEARFVTNHGAGALYALEADPAGIAQLTAEIGKMEGVTGAWPSADYATLGLPAPADNALVADAMFEAQPGYSFGDEAAGEEYGQPKYLGNHGQRGGYPDNHALFVAAGPAIRRGVQLPVIRSRDVAPTIAAALGVVLAPVEGVTLEAALG
jgi:predicted AlkP superfamily pyrophosphatase or phosphodiesterase